MRGAWRMRCARASVVSVYVPPPAIRALREVCRGRQQLVRVRTRLVQMLRALLLRSGAAERPSGSSTRRAGSPGWGRWPCRPGGGQLSAPEQLPAGPRRSDRGGRAGASAGHGRSDCGRLDDLVGMARC